MREGEYILPSLGKYLLAHVNLKEKAEAFQVSEVYQHVLIVMSAVNEPDRMSCDFAQRTKLLSGDVDAILDLGRSVFTSCVKAVREKS